AGRELHDERVALARRPAPERDRLLTVRGRRGPVVDQAICAIAVLDRDSLRDRPGHLMPCWRICHPTSPLGGTLPCSTAWHSERTSATSQSSPTSTTGRRRSSTLSSGRRAASANTRTSTSGSWTPWI